MHYNEQRLEELEKQYAEMGETIKQMKEKKQWEPEGGRHYLRTDGTLGDCESEEITRLFGVERKTREQAEKARDKIRVFNRLLAYVDEFAPDYDFIVGDDNAYFIELDSGIYCFDFDSLDLEYRVGQVYMPKQTAIDLCEKLNSGEVVL